MSDRSQLGTDMLQGAVECVKFWQMLFTQICGMIKTSI